MPRRAVLSDEQRVSLLGLPVSESELTRYWTLTPDDLRIIAARRRPHNRLGFAVQLCALRYPGRLLRPGELVPTIPLNFVADQLGVEAEVLAEYAVRGPTRYEQLDTLRDLFGFVPLSKMAQADLQGWLLPVALTTTSGAELVRLLAEEFRNRRSIIPGITLLERMAAQALLDAERHVADLLTRDLNWTQRQGLDALLSIRPGTSISVLAWARQPAGRPGHRSFRAILDRLEAIRELELTPSLTESIHPERLRRLTQEGARLTSQHLRTLEVTRRRSILVATALETMTALTDDAILMFDRLIGQMFKRVERGEDAEIKRDRRTINGKVRLLAQLSSALLFAKTSGGDPIAAVESVISWEDLGREAEEARRLVKPDIPDPFDLAARNYPILRFVGPAFATSFAFGAVPAARALHLALDIVRDFQLGRIRKVPSDAPISFVRQGWRRAIGTRELDRRTYELCVFVELRDRLRAGDVWVDGSRRYRAVEQQLIPARVFAAMRAVGPVPVSAPASAQEWLDTRHTLLSQRLTEVADKAQREGLQDVALSAGRLKISPLKGVTPDEANLILAPLYAQLPTIRITDLLAEVDRWTGFASCFTHLQSRKVADDPRAVLTAVLAEATNLGHGRMADACSLVTHRQLAWLASWHLREETYGQALAKLVDAQHRVPLAAVFGSGTSSSSDGQHFPLDRRAAATGAVNPHKGSEPSVSFYTHVSDRYAPFHTKVISATAGEAAHVLDGLLHHGADLQIQEHHVDGGGVSDHVFALCHLLGFRFAPRIPNIAARRLHLFDGIDPGPDIAPLVAGKVDADLISAHWDDVLRLATSIRTGVVRASLMLERLGSYPRANGLALALREIGRVERTLFTLDWIESPEQRRRATRELNKGEAENALKRAIFFHRVGRIRDHGLQAQSHRASALSLVASAIVLWNTTYLEAARQRLSECGREVPINMLQHLSPLGWQHVNLTGDYLWADVEQAAEGLRPLRELRALS